MLGAVLTPATGPDATPLVAIVVEGYHGDRLADDERVARKLDAIHERLMEGPELIILAGSFCFFGMFFVAFLKLFPVIAIAEVKELVIHDRAHSHGGAH